MARLFLTFVNVFPRPSPSLPLRSTSDAVFGNYLSISTVNKSNAYANFEKQDRKWVFEYLQQFAKYLPYNGHGTVRPN